MGNSRAESYLKTYTIYKEEFGALGCYDGHSMCAEDISQVIKHEFKYFYNVEDGYFDEYYIICSKKELSKDQVKEIDETTNDILNRRVQ